MPSNYEHAVSALYRAPHESFVSERRRLVGELKAGGDKSGAAELAKLGRPPISAWVVNQLWWHAREAFDELFATAARLRKGDLSASAAHRKAIARLAARAQQLLTEGGHSANDATLRRVTMTLSGLAAAGGFEPDGAGALTKDRDPPGFEAFGIASSSDEPVDHEPSVRQKSAPPGPAHAAKNDGRDHDSHGSSAAKGRQTDDAKRVSDAAERKREAEAAAAERKREAEAAAAERKREAEAQAKRQAQRKKLESELREARAELAEREHERDRIEKQLTTAEREVELARAAVDAAQAELEADRAS